MAISLTLKHTLKGNNFVEYIFDILFTGNYPVGGEPLNLGPYIGITNRKPILVTIFGNRGFDILWDEGSETIKVFGGTADHTHVENLTPAYTQGPITDTPVGGITNYNNPRPQYTTGTAYNATITSKFYNLRATFLYR